MGAVTSARAAEKPSAADAPVAVRCPDWQPEARAEVEARVRAALLAEVDAFVHVAIGCEADGSIRVAVETRRGSLARVVERLTARRADDVVATVDTLLGEFDQARRAGVSEDPTLAPAAVPVPDAPAPAARPVPGAPAPAATPTREAPAPALQSRQAADTPGVGAFVTGAGAFAELWREHAAVGADLTLGAQRGSFGWGLLVGGANAFGEPATFDVQEWHGHARLSLTFKQLAGLSLAAGAGASLLVTTLHAGVSSESATSLGAASFSLELARPFWLGAFAIVPDVGLRIFGARRTVRTDDREELLLPLFAPRAGVWLLYGGG